jgi:polyisoprenoid-binding protein YceI
VARYRIVPGRSRVWIEARSTLHPIRTETDGLEGWLDFEVRRGGRVDLRMAPSAHLELPVAQLSSGNALEDRELRRRVDARRYPTIAGDLTVMAATDVEGRYRVEGDLTFKGVTRRYEDEMTLEAVNGTMVILAGEKTFDVRDFGLEPPRILMLRVEPNVKVKVAIVAQKMTDGEG